MVTISEKGFPLDLDKIKELEEKIQKVLPYDYKLFLAKTNGGRPENDIIDIEKLEGSPTDVQIFFGLTRDVESSNILWNLSNAVFLNNQYLPIACDSGGNIFCLSLLQEDFGAIFYADWQGNEPGLYHVSNSFTEFLNRLKNWKD
jgi:hypothetical protein